jgi:hypothetical protein
VGEHTVIAELARRAVSLHIPRNGTGSRKACCW